MMNTVLKQMVAKKLMKQMVDDEYGTEADGGGRIVRQMMAKKRMKQMVDGE